MDNLLRTKSGNPPVFEIEEELLTALSKNNQVILQAPPGAGKSTVLPLLILYEKWLGDKKIIMLEPRRLAAKAVAARLAWLLDEKPGETVGYRIRFETKVSAKTRIEVVTEGILTRMLQSDSALEDTAIVIFDEFHERSIHTDLSLALVLESQAALRADLKMLVMSATLDTAPLIKVLDQAPVITSSGRQHPVDIVHIPSYAGESLPAHTSRAIKKALTEETGDILVFLPGTGEIIRTSEILEKQNVNASVTPLYGDLPFNRQLAAIQPDPAGKRKIVLSTSIAETSLTIEGIKTVIDSGYSRAPMFSVASGFTRLETVRVTRDTAEQRTGRAGRLGPGKCYRLWAEGYNHHLLPARKPEILEADLTPLILELARWGNSEPSKYRWISAPPSAAVQYSLELLHNLEALDENGKITDRGKEMAGLPAHPRVAHMLLEAHKLKLLPLAADLAALLEERDLLGNEAGADINLRLESLQRWRNDKQAFNRSLAERIDRIANTWCGYFKIKNQTYAHTATVTGLVISFAYPERIARKREGKGNYKLVSGKLATLSEHDPLIHEEWLSVASLDGGKKGKIFLASPIDPSEMENRFTNHTVIRWDEQNNQLIARTETRLGAIVVDEKPAKNISPDEISVVIFDQISRNGKLLLDWNLEAEQFQNRVLSLRKWRPGDNWPDLSTDHLLQHPQEWLSGWIETIRKKEDFQKLNLYKALLSILDWQQQEQLNLLAPEKIQVPSGSLIGLRYSNDGSPPVLAVRLQELFGLTDTPKINKGTVPLVLHLLSPGYKPVQVTGDLKSFWTNTYPGIRKELRIRYPKHSWPEDPLQAMPVRGPKKRGT